MFKAYVAIGTVWLVLTVAWAILTVARLWAGDDYHHQLVLALVSSGLATQAFNQAAVMSRLGSLR